MTPPESTAGDDMPLTTEQEAAEREAFGAWALQTICNASDLERGRLTGYANRELNQMWQGWYARALKAHEPAQPAEAPECCGGDPTCDSREHCIETFERMKADAVQPCPCVSASVDGCWWNHHGKVPDGGYYCRRDPHKRAAPPSPPLPQDTQSERALLQRALDFIGGTDDYKSRGKGVALMNEIKAALAAAPTAPQEAPREDFETDPSVVICPACCSQFRAIPPDVQRLMLDAGFEPPFTAPPRTDALPVGTTTSESGEPKYKADRTAEDSVSNRAAPAKSTFLGGADSERTDAPALTDEQCDAIIEALDSWCIEIDWHEFGLPQRYDSDKYKGRDVIRRALRTASKPSEDARQLLCDLLEHEAAGPFTDRLPTELLSRWQSACDAAIDKARDADGGAR
jgi:hypothetical protein